MRHGLSILFFFLSRFVLFFAFYPVSFYLGVGGSVEQYIM
jgi:hypothetical protein